MARTLPTHSRNVPAREFAVPAIMVGTMGLYLYGSWGLSRAALLFPVVLIAVIVAAVTWSLVAAVMWRRTDRDTAPEDEAQGPVTSFTPWSLVAISAVLILIQNLTGTLFALLAIVFAAQVIFNRERPLRSLAIAMSVTVPVYILFKYVLYVRFPVGVLGIG